MSFINEVTFVETKCFLTHSDSVLSHVGNKMQIYETLTIRNFHFEISPVSFPRENSHWFLQMGSGQTTCRRQEHFKSAVTALRFSIFTVFVTHLDCSQFQLRPLSPAGLFWVALANQGRDISIRHRPKQEQVKTSWER